MPPRWAPLLVVGLVLAMSLPATSLPTNQGEPYGIIDPDLDWILPAPPNHYWLDVQVANTTDDNTADIFAGSSEGLYRLDGNTGAPVWRALTGAVTDVWITDLDNDNRLDIVTLGTLTPPPHACIAPTLLMEIWAIRVVDARTGMLKATYTGSLPNGKVADIRTVDLNQDETQDIVMSTYEWDHGHNGAFALDGATLLDAGQPLGAGIAGDEAVLWAYETPRTPIMRPGNLATYQDPTTGEAWVYLVQRDVHAIHGATGTQAWRAWAAENFVQVANVTGDPEPEVLAAGMRAHMPATGEVQQVYEPDGSRVKIGPGAFGVVDTGTEHLVILTGGADAPDGTYRNHVWGLTADEGELEWTVRMTERGMVSHPPRLNMANIDGEPGDEVVLAQGHELYVPGVTGDNAHHYPHVIIIDPVSGHVIWEQRLPGPTRATFDTGDLDGDGRAEVVTAMHRAIAAWSPTLTDHGSSLERGDEQETSIVGCLTPE